MNSSKLARKTITSLLILIMSLTLFIHYNKYDVKADEVKNNIIILLDNSGSMSNNGLGKLAKIAGNMVLDTVREDEANIGIITFGDKATILNDITQPQDYNALKDKLNSVMFDENYTNMKDGLEKSINELSKVSGKKKIIILSDGKETAEGGLPTNHNEQLSSISKRAQDLNIQVHAIALADDIEREFLNNITSATEGSFREGKTADKLFEALTSIIGQQNGFMTVANYTTGSNKENKIKLSSMIDEVIINVAACDNIQPQLEVRVNNKVVEPTKNGDLYSVYRFENTEQSEIQISSLGDMNTSVIVQAKSSATLNISGNYNNYLSIPAKIPMDFKLELETGGKPLPEAIFVQRDGVSIESYDGKTIFKDTYEGNKVGTDIIRYTVKDGSGGIIAVSEVSISINDYPPFYYDSIVTSIIQGNKLNVTLTPKDETAVNELGGTLIIKQGDSKQEIPFKNNGGKLVAEKVIDVVKDGEYYAYIRGTSAESGKSFEYRLPSISLKVSNKPSISIVQSLNKSKDYRLGSKIKLNFTIEQQSIIPKDTIVNIYDTKDNKIGNFTAKANYTGEIAVDIKPKERSSNLEIRFKTDNGTDITESIKTNIRVLSTFPYIFESFGKPIIIIATIIGIIIAALLVIYCYGISIYKKNIENNYKDINIAYTIKPSVVSNYITDQLSKTKRCIYLNYYEKQKELILEEEYINPIGEFDYINKYEKLSKWIQGYKYKLDNGDIFEIIYKPIEEQEIYLYDELQEGEIIYKSGTTISCAIGNKVIDIEI